MDEGDATVAKPPALLLLVSDAAVFVAVVADSDSITAARETSQMLLLLEVARWQNLITSSPWSASGWRAKEIQGKEGIKLFSVGPNTYDL